MFAYEKRLQFPVKIKNTNPDIARLIMSGCAHRRA